MVVIGADVASGGWVVARWDGSTLEMSLHATVTDIVDTHADAAVYGVDIPIGLPVVPPRLADQMARDRLGSRRNSVFDAIPIDLLDARDYREALAWSRERFGRGISAQSFALRDRIVDARAAASDDERIVEVHPEVSFAEMAARPMAWSKKSWNGQAERRRALRDAGFVLPNQLDEAGAVPVDDVLDAVAAAWSAMRVARGTAHILGEPEIGAIYA